MGTNSHLLPAVGQSQCWSVPPKVFPKQCGPRVRLDLGAADGTRAPELQELFHILSSLLQEPGHELCSPAQLSAQKLKEETQKYQVPEKQWLLGCSQLPLLGRDLPYPLLLLVFSDLSLWSRVSTH